jgi:glucarate dehydratase
MCTLDVDEIPQTIRLRAIDVQLLDPCDWGGITAAWKAAAAYEVFQIGVGFHSGGEAGISTALQLQLAAALPVLPYAIDSHYHHQTADVITKPFEYVDGCFELPEGPGLGVEIDEDALARLEELNRRSGDLVFYGDPTRPEPPWPGMW